MIIMNKEKCKELVDKTNKYIKDKPIKSVNIAFAIGTVIGILAGIGISAIRRRRK